MRILLGSAVALALSLTGCLDPGKDVPGLRLAGDVVETLPSDWSFTNEYGEIAVEVVTPYLLPHSVRIWCAEMNGALYVRTRRPEQRRWPGWVERDPRVRLRIGERIYEVRLTRLGEPHHIARVQRAYALKYDRRLLAPGEGPPMRYWRVGPRT